MDLSFFIGIVLGFTIYYLMSEGRNEKSEARVHRFKNFLGKLIPSLKFKIKGSEVHIHHWVYLIAILLILFLFFSDFLLSYPLIAGFLIGGILEGLLYKDKFNMIGKT